jgi:hypothetical protein
MKNVLEYFIILKYLLDSFQNCRGSRFKYNMLLEVVWNKNKKKKLQKKLFIIINLDFSQWNYIFSYNAQ